MTTLLLTVMLAVGVALVSYGAWLAWPPAGFIVAGAALVVIPVRYARAAEPQGGGG